MSMGFTPPTLPFCFALALTNEGISHIKGLVPDKDHDIAFGKVLDTDYFCTIYLDGEPTQICIYSHHASVGKVYITMGRPISTSGLFFGQIRTEGFFKFSYTRKGIPSRILALADEDVPNYITHAKDLAAVIMRQHLVASNNWDIDEETYSWLDLLVKKYS